MLMTTDPRKPNCFQSSNVLLQPDTDTHKRWMQELDLTAEGLKELKDAGVVVLWRPFHEMNGGWFWWGAKEPEKFIAVWRHRFDYFSKTKGLDNLLWFYMTLTAGAPRAGLWLSRDKGKTWEAFNDLPFSNIQRVEFDPTDEARIHVATFGGSVWRGPILPRQSSRSPHHD